MEDPILPEFDLAKKVLPGALISALEFIFSHGVFETMLVGGTALAGFYAAHRRSDDLDLFVASEPAFESTSRVIRQLDSIGAKLSSEFSSTTYYRCTCELQAHRFTVDVVLDKNLYKVGRAIPSGGNILVASLDTLLKMKAATLVSRAGEKDLFDLAWLFAHFKEIDLAQFIALGQEIDGGVNAESILISLSTSTIRPEACNFILDDNPLSNKEVAQDLEKLKTRLIIEISSLARASHSNSPLIKLVELVKTLSRKKKND